MKEIKTLNDVYEKLKDPEIQLSTKFPYSHKIKTKSRSINLSLGRIWLQLLLPDDFRFVNEPVTKSKMDEIIRELIKNYEPAFASDIVSKIQEEAFKLAAINPRSFRIDGFIPSEAWTAKKEAFVKKADSLSDSDFLKESKKLAEELMKELDDKQIPIQDCLNSGTKGSMSDWQSLLVSRGFVVDLEGNISRIVASENDGKNIEAYYKAGAQGRRNYFVRSTLTSKPGYLARKITMANANIKISAKDCRTRKLLEVFVDAPRANSFVGRYYRADGETKLVESADEIKNKLIKFRSPLFCLQKDGICQTCYGELSSKLDNSNIGILAGGAINNETVNALMKMRHKATQVDLVDVDFTKLKTKFGSKSELINRIFKIEPKSITANEDLMIILDQNDYRDESITDFGEKFVLPGILEVTVGEGEKREILNLPFNFDVNLHKPENYPWLFQPDCVWIGMLQTFSPDI